MHRHLELGGVPSGSTWIRLYPDLSLTQPTMPIRPQTALLRVLQSGYCVEKPYSRDLVCKLSDLA